MSLAHFKIDVTDEVASILASDFVIDVTQARTVPHSSDAAITFPNVDEKTQGAKLIETTVLYVDMRRSTQLNFQHRKSTVAKLYSAFVRAMTRCATRFNGEVRGIIGDRVMILFQPDNCFTNAVDTAELMSSVCKYVINKNFRHNEVTFGIGIDHGNMLATKTGIRRHGALQQSYRSLVWLGRPANVASKLTDNANKPEEVVDITRVNVAYLSGTGLRYEEEASYDFVRRFTRNPVSGLMVHDNPLFHSFYPVTRQVVIKESTPAILMTEAVFDGFRSARPDAVELKNDWITPVDISIPDYKGPIYGANVIYTTFTQ